mmetsp:Transcript_30276/g.61736  ORF Transcript_30276/g.61736 Transcript_30276/m.61736 type:complete len:89 (+) Transcript_30276:112-378(+)
MFGPTREMNGSGRLRDVWQQEFFKWEKSRGALKGLEPIICMRYGMVLLRQGQKLAFTLCSRRGRKQSGEGWLPFDGKDRAVWEEEPFC